MTKVVLKGFLAGMLISMGCVIYTICSSKLLGSFLFSFGLFAIVHLQLNLYTGKIGYLVDDFSWKYGKELLLSLFGNTIGALFTSAMIKSTRLDLYDTILKVVELKLNDTFLSIFILSFFCGILMFLAVELFKKSEHYLSKILSVVFCVMIFILCGFEHCVANMFYLFFVCNYNILWLFMMVMGNTCGSLFICWSLRQINK